MSCMCSFSSPDQGNEGEEAFKLYRFLRPVTAGPAFLMTALIYLYPEG